MFGRGYDEVYEEWYLSAVRDAGLGSDIIDDDELGGGGGVAADPKEGQLSHDTDVGEHVLPWREHCIQVWKPEGFYWMTVWRH